MTPPLSVGRFPRSIDCCVIGFTYSPPLLCLSIDFCYSRVHFWREQSVGEGRPRASCAALGRAFFPRWRGDSTSDMARQTEAEDKCSR